MNDNLHIHPGDLWSFKSGPYPTLFNEDKTRELLQIKRREYILILDVKDEVHVLHCSTGTFGVVNRTWFAFDDDVILKGRKSS